MFYALRALNDLTTANFGLLIAYLLPGFTFLWGVGVVSTTIRNWLGTVPENAPTVGGFLYLTVASVAAGLLVSTVRWLIVDTVHHATGVQRPSWNFAKLHIHREAFESIILSQYRYYQWYGGMLVASIFTYAMERTLGDWQNFSWPVDFLFLALEVILFLGSRDTLQKYYRRTEAIFACGAEKPTGS